MKHLLFLRKMALFAMLLALCWLLPFLTANNPSLGNLFCLMHLPVFLCGFILNEKWGLSLGVLAPLSRSLFFSAPKLYPTAICMAVELAVYGLICGLLFKVLNKKLNVSHLFLNAYISLISAMLLGRFTSGFMHFILGLVDKNPYTFKIFMSASFISAWAGILIQLVLIPPLIVLLKKKNIIKMFHEEEKL